MNQFCSDIVAKNKSLLVEFAPIQFIEQLFFCEYLYAIQDQKLFYSIDGLLSLKILSIQSY
jgi:hypothetical protein